MALLLNMRKLLPAAICTLAAVSLARADGEKESVLFDDSEVVTKELPSWFKASFLDLQEDLAEAVEGGKQGLMLVFDTEGCAYCKAFLKHTLNDPMIQADVRANFDVVSLDMFSDVEVIDFSGRTLPAKEFSTDEGATVSPTVVFYRADGAVLFRAIGYYPPARFRTLLDYVISGRYAEQNFRQYSVSLPENLAASEPANVPLSNKAPLMLDRSAKPAQFPLLVLFEGEECAECRQLQSDVLSYPPVHKLLERYDVVRMNWEDTRTPLLTPAGERSNPADWAMQLAVSRVPAIVFFNEEGAEVFRLESLVLHQRMERALLYVLEKAYARDMTYQQFTREKSIEKIKTAQSVDTGRDDLQPATH